MAPPFKTIEWRKGKNSPKTIPFKTIMVLSRPFRPDLCLSTTEWVTSVMKQIIWTPSPWCLTAQRHVKHPQHHQQCHPPRCHSPRSPSFSPPSITSIQRVISRGPAQRTPHPRAGRDTSLNQPFIRPHNVNQGLTPSLSALLAEMSPLAPYQMTATGQSQGPRKNLYPQVSHFQTIWLISRPFGSFSRPSWCYIMTPMGQFPLHRPPWTTFKTIKKEKIINFLTPKKTDDKEDS